MEKTNRQAAREKAAIRIQAAQRRKEAMSFAETKRMLRTLQRRKSAEMAAVSIQKVVRGRVARAAKGAEVARREVREQQDIIHLTFAHL